MLKTGWRESNEWLLRACISSGRKRVIIIKLPQKGELSIFGNKRDIKLLNFDNLSGSYHQNQVNCGTSVDGIRSLFIDLIGQRIRSRDVIGRLSVINVIGCEDYKK